MTRGTPLELLRTRYANLTPLAASTYWVLAVRAAIWRVEWLDMNLDVVDEVEN
jgi:hypothetical protein